MLRARALGYALWLALSVGSWLLAIKVLGVALAALPP